MNTSRDLARGVFTALPARHGSTSVFLHDSGDHVVIRYRKDHAIVLAFESPAWKRAITRALKLLEEDNPCA